MALNGLICADVPLSNYYSLTHSLHHQTDWFQYKLEVCALCGDADPRRVCRELHFV